MAAQKGLGRGLGALLGDLNPLPEDAGSPRTLPIQKIEPNPNQPRRRFEEEELLALSDSIAQHGLIQPLAVRAMDGGYYQIIAGERRWRAARMAGLSEVPVVVLEADDRTVMELALVENLQREDLNPIEQAQGLQSLIRDYGLTQEQAAERIGCSRPAVANSLRLLALPDEVQKLVEQGALSAGHARAVLSLKTAKQQKAAARQIVDEQLSVRQAEQLCRRLAKADEPAPPKKAQPAVDYIAECEKTLTHRLGRSVRIVNGARRGRFELEFYGADDLQRLYEALQTLNIKE